MILLSGCASAPDTDFLVGSETCRPPCWLDIQPGVTASNEMIKILRQHEEKGDGDLTLLDTGITVWRTVGGRNIVIFKNDNDVVSRIRFDLRPISIHLDDITELIGEPSNLNIGLISNGYFSTVLFYPENGLAVLGSSNDIENITGTNIGFVIQPDLGVAIIEFVQISDVTTMVNLLYGGEAVPEALSEIQDWKGYGIYRK
jgi:hypothetical protein